MEILTIDFDGVIADTVKAFCLCYNDHYKSKNELKVDYRKVLNWDFSPAIQNISSNVLNDIFNSKKLFYYLDIYENCSDVLKQLKNKYYLRLYTIGTTYNIKNKIDFLHNTKLSSIFDTMIFKDNNYSENNKSDLCHSGILLDDNQDNLFSLPNNVRGIKFGLTYNYNKDWAGESCVDWLEVQKLLLL